MEQEPHTENPIETLEKKLDSLRNVVLKDWYLNPTIRKEGEALAIRMEDSLAYSKTTSQAVHAGIYDTEKLLLEVERFVTKAIDATTSTRESH